MRYKNAFPKAGKSMYLHGIDVQIIALDIRNKKTTCLRNHFNQIKALTVFWETGKNERKLIGFSRFDNLPFRSKRDIFHMYEFTFMGDIFRHQIGRWPDPDVHSKWVGAGIAAVNDHLLFFLHDFFDHPFYGGLLSGDRLLKRRMAHERKCMGL